MRIKKRVLRKIISVFAAILLLINSLTPYLLITPIVRPVSAQEEITPTGVPVGQVAPSLIPSETGTSPRLGFFQRIWNFILGLFKR